MAIAGLDQGAEIGRQLGLGRLDGQMAAAAETDLIEAGGHDDLGRGKLAEGAADLFALLLQLLDGQEALLLGGGKVFKMFGKGNRHIWFLLKVIVF